MKKTVAEAVKHFNEVVQNYETNVRDKDSYISFLKSQIIDYTKKYYETAEENEKSNIVSVLRDYYDLLYYLKAQIDERRMYVLDEDLENLPNVYVLDQKPERFAINDELLESMNLEQGLTEDQAEELLKWTANNTRDNINMSLATRHSSENVYDNCSLGGACGFAQFSSLYPLAKMGLKVTVNNTSSFSNSRHAFGTVVIPINQNGTIINKRYLIDCTYRQFFTLPFNVVSRYISSHPEIGFVVTQSDEEKAFAKELLRKGFVEATDENLEMYLKPFYASSVSFDKIDQIDQNFSQMKLVETLEDKQEEFDYSEEEFMEWGMNLSFNQESKKL